MADPAGEPDRGALRLEFRGSAITSNAGLLPYRELDDAMGLSDTGGDVLADARTGKNGRHQLVGLLRQSVFGRLAGYEDVNDADLLCRDPAMRWVVGDRAIDGTAASASQMAAPRRSGPLPTTAPESGKCRLTQAAQFPAPRGRASHHFWLSTDQLRSNLLWSGLDHGLNARFPTRPSTDTSYDVNMTQTDPGNVS